MYCNNNYCKIIYCCKSTNLCKPQIDCNKCKKCCKCKNCCKCKQNVNCYIPNTIYTNFTGPFNYDIWGSSLFNSASILFNTFTLSISGPLHSDNKYGIVFIKNINKPITITFNFTYTDTDINSYAVAFRNLNTSPNNINDINLLDPNITVYIANGTNNISNNFNFIAEPNKYMGFVGFNCSLTINNIIFTTSN